MDEQNSTQSSAAVETVAAEPTAAETKPVKQRTTYLREAVGFDAGQPDGATYTVPVTLIRAGWSANNRHYSRDVLAKAAPVFEGVKAYADHPGKEDEKNRPERSVKDIVGYYTDVKVADDGALRANLHIVGEAQKWLYPLVHETVAHNPNLIGLSINALGKTTMGERDGRKGVIVEDIVKGNSTDIVTTPAAGGTFERLTASADEFTADLLAALDYDEWRESRPDFIQRLREELKTLRQDEALKAAIAKQDELTEQVKAEQERNKELEEAKRAIEAQLSDMRAEMTRREKAAFADKLLAEAKLPVGAWQTSLRDGLMRESNTGNWGALASAERAKYLEAAASQPVQPHVTLRPARPELVEGNAVAEALGVSILPLPGENAQQFAIRKAQLLRG